MNTEDILKSLNTQAIGKNIVFKSETDSTNLDAKRNSDYLHGTLFIADTQSSGRGRLGRSWESKASDGIYMSILLKPDILPEKIPEITLIAGISVCRALSGFNAKIKWPNDIIIGSKKVCGILNEMSATEDKINYVVCGMGINVNTKEFAPEIKDIATSLFSETGITYKREEIICCILSEFEELYNEFIKNGLKNIIDEYKSLCKNLGREVKAIFKDKTVTGTAIDITDTGELIIKTNDETITVASGEVSVRGMLGYI